MCDEIREGARIYYRTFRWRLPLAHEDSPPCRCRFPNLRLGRSWNAARASDRWTSLMCQPGSMEWLGGAFFHLHCCQRFQLSGTMLPVCGINVIRNTSKWNPISIFLDIKSSVFHRRRPAFFTVSYATRYHSSNIVCFIYSNDNTVNNRYIF